MLLDKAKMVGHWFKWYSTQSDVAVSFIVPVFNKSEYLESCLASIRNQSLDNTEIICVDDASTDDSTPILIECSKTDSRLRIVRNETNLGAGQARNIGIKAARGRFIRFVDADDLLPPESTELMHSRALATASDVVKGSLAVFSQRDPAKYETVSATKNRTGTKLREEPQLWIPWWHTSYLISRDLIHRNQLSYPSLRQGEDPVFLALVLTCAERISMVEDIVYLYRKYRKSTGSAASSFSGVVDFLKHASIIQSVYATYHADCWHHGYRPFVLEELRKLLIRCNLDTEQTQYVTREAVRIFGEEARLQWTP